ncbi:alpha/beta hydrolase [Roseomonas populi]|uniref:Alpha/beta hydrolase n=1 Tax=Roseomonas populi TaxID=3121582 RepID=A0ABT1XBP8_9PROT|nr:alpha/beta hydrolase [Roseomonas pecuniae]MCR0985171.1 alpha/beta hydrolase [Roseomonas pecuniae]
MSTDVQTRPVSGPDIAVSEHMVPSGDPDILLYLRNKRRADAGPARPDRTLLFVHGASYPSHTSFDLALDGRSWMDVMAARGFDVWCLDIRGYGRSTRPAQMDRPAEEGAPIAPGEVALRDVAAAMGFIRAARGVERVVAMGWSWGTALMARFAAENPERVEKLVLYAPLWIRETPSLVQAGPGPLGAYRTITRESARERWLSGIPEERRADQVPAAWLQAWADATWGTDAVGAAQDPPVLRAPNGSVQDGQEYWSARRPFYDPAAIRAPTLLVLGEWDRDTPPYMAQTLFPLLTAAPRKRLAILGEGTHSMMMERTRDELHRVVQDFLET